MKQFLMSFLRQCQKLNQKYHIVTWMFAVLFSVVLWLYVITTDNPSRQLGLKDVPVQLLNSDTIRETNSLVCTNDMTLSVSVTLSGTVNRLQELDSDSVVVRCDLASIREPGVYEVGYDISVPYGVTVVSAAPSTLTVNLEELITEKIPVTYETEGILRAGLVLDSVSYPETITVTGLASELEQAVSARFILPLGELTDTVSLPCNLECLNSSGTVFTSRFLSCAQESIPVNCTVLAYTRIPLTVSLLPGKGASSQDANAVISPASVKVIGPVSLVRDTVSSINIGAISLRGGPETIEETFDIPLPEGLDFYMSSETADVTVSFPGLEVQTFRLPASVIEFTGVPNGYTPTAVTDAISFMLRAPADVLDSITDEDITVKVSLSSISPDSIYESTLSLPVNVFLSSTYSAKVGVFENCLVDVRLIP